MQFVAQVSFLLGWTPTIVGPMTFKDFMKAGSSEYVYVKAVNALQLLCKNIHGLYYIYLIARYIDNYIELFFVISSQCLEVNLLGVMLA